MLVNEDEYFRGQVEGDIFYGVQGPPGPAGKSAYAYAKENGYSGSESDFSRLLGQFPERIDTAAQNAETAADAAYRAIDALGNTGISIVNTDSGEVISLNDSAERPLVGMKVYGKTTQNGTPSPDAPVALDSVGADGSVAVIVCGKNLFSATWEQGSIDSNTGNDYSSSAVVRCGFIPVTPLTTYALSRSVTTSYIQVRGYDADKNYIGGGASAITLVQGSSVGNPMNAGHSSCAIKTNENVHYLRFTDVSNDLTTKYQMELGSTVTAYEPYKGSSVSISTPNGLPGIPVASGGNYTDENGQQWLCDEVDFEKGVYVQRVANVTFTDSTGWEMAGASGGGKRFMNRSLSIPIQGSTVPTVKANLLCSAFPTLTANQTWYKSTGISGDHAQMLIYYDTIEQTPSALGAYFASNPMTVVYQMATPIETALSAEELAQYSALHTNYPDTTVFNDENAGMEVKYVADTKLYIDKKFDQLAAAMLNN